MKKSPLFIVIEGLDGTGKTTAGELLASRIDAKFMDSLPGAFREHQKTFYSILNDHGWYLHMMSMLTHLHTEIEKILAEGQHVVITRYWYTTWAYYAAKCDQKGVKALSIHPEELGIIAPDLAVFLAVDEPERLRRLSLRNEKSGEDLLTEQQIFQELLCKRYEQVPLERFDIGGKSPAVVVDMLMDRIATI